MVRSESQEKDITDKIETAFDKAKKQEAGTAVGRQLQRARISTIGSVPNNRSLPSSLFVKDYKSGSEVSGPTLELKSMYDSSVQEITSKIIVFVEEKLASGELIDFNEGGL